MNLFLQYFIASLLFTISLTKEVSANLPIDALHNQEEELYEVNSIPQRRRTLTYTYAYKKDPIIENTLADDDFASAYEEDILHHTATESRNKYTRNKKGNQGSKKYPKKKKRSHLTMDYEHSQRKTPRNGRKMQESSSSVVSRDSLDNEFRLQTFLSSLARRRSDSRPSRSGSESESSSSGSDSRYDSSSYDRRYGSSRYDSRYSRSYGKGKGKGKRKSHKSGRKGKRKSHRSGSKGKGKKKGRSYDRRSYSYSTESYDTGSYSTDSYSTESYDTGSYSTDSYSTESYDTGSYSTDNSAESKDIGSIENIGDTFGDEFIEFLNEYYQYSANIDPESSDEEDAFEEFLNNYYKFKEGKKEGSSTDQTGGNLEKYYSKPVSYYNDNKSKAGKTEGGVPGKIDDDLDNYYYSPDAYYKVTPSPVPWQEENYRDPDDRTEFNTPAPSSTTRKSEKVTYYYDDIFNDNMPTMKRYPRPSPSKAPFLPTNKKQGDDSEPSFNFNDDDFGEKRNQSPSASKKNRPDKKSIDIEATAPSPSSHQKSAKQVDGDDYYYVFNDDLMSSTKKQSPPHSTRKSTKNTKNPPPSGRSSRKNTKTLVPKSKKSDSRVNSRKNDSNSRAPTSRSTKVNKKDKSNRRFR